MTQFTWKGTVDGRWGRGENWDGGEPPEEDDDVVVGGAGSSPDPQGAKVKALELQTGQLASSIRVSESFAWSGGDLVGGIALGAATMEVTGGDKHHTRKAIVVESRASFSGATVGLSEGAALTINGTMSTSGEVRLRWTAGRNALLVCPGALTVTSGNFVLDDVIGKLSGTVDIAPGGALSVQSHTYPTFLIGRCRVRGGGTLRVHAGDGNSGGLYSVATARVEGGTTVELGTGGYLWGADHIRKGTEIFGRISGRHELVIDGQLHWVGGRTYADIRLGPTAVLVIDGPASHEQEGGTLQLDGSGAVRASSRLNLRIGAWRVFGDLLLEGPLTIGQSSQWMLDNRGTVRVAGSGPVTLDDGVLDNRGTIDVQAGTLRIGYSAELTERATGTIMLAAGTTLEAESQLVLGGRLSGSGQVVADLEPHGVLQPGSSSEIGTLTVDGALQLGPSTKTQIRVQDPANFTRVVSMGQVFLAGTLEVRADGYTPAVGDSMQIISGAAGSSIAGRFTAATFPRPIGGRYVYLRYNGASAKLAEAMSTPGFDMAHPPSANVLQAWVPASPYRWVGFYLQSPCHGKPSWNGLRPFLTSLGLGILVIYVGQQSPGTSPCTVNTTTAAQGVTDAREAIARATAEGFPPGTWIYLDVERSAVGGHPTDGMLVYVQAWFDEVLTDGTFSPGLYAHQVDVSAIDPTVTSTFGNHGRVDRARYWVVGGPATSALTDAPWRSTVPEAVCWQQRLDFNEAWGGHTLRIDRSVSCISDPSAP